ncbi:response regulator of the LytR/AlgR family [Echinicola vietnamensis DSM 17526]|uniref:Response regulator of the LytR/AlgR family n=2 Tax=Echinicola TaxID=390846 RepID=L0FX79_ECHVK|nr:response regulator of the LytR/AlgR family [Echinicola vietnamensis DSM 17526]
MFYICSYILTLMCVSEGCKRRMEEKQSFLPAARPAHSAVGYNDLYFRLIIGVMGALFISLYGTMEGFWEHFLMPAFYVEFFSSLLITLVIIEFIYRTTVYLDKYYDWQQRPIIRLCLQFFLGVMVPGVIDFILAAVYFKVYGLNIIEDTYYVAYALPLIMAMIFIFNLYYVCHYFFLKLRSVQHAGNGKKQTILVQKGTKNIPLPVVQISYIERSNRHNFLTTLSGESYLISYSLEELEDLLDPRLFFRVNRQVLVHFASCRHFELGEHGKLLLYLKPATDTPIVVSQKRAKRFKEWMDR